MTTGEGVMPVIEVGAVPGNAEPVQPGYAKFGLKTLAEITFGLGIQVNASSDIHRFVGSLSLMLSGFGALNGRANGVEASTGLRDRSADGGTGCNAASRSQ